MRSRIGPGAMPSLDRPSPMTFTICRLGEAGDAAEQGQRRPAAPRRSRFHPAAHDARHVVHRIGERPRRLPPTRSCVQSAITSCAPAPDHSSSAHMLACAGPPIRPAIDRRLAQRRRHAAGDQVELVVGDAGGAIDRQHQGEVHRVHGATHGWERTAQAGGNRGRVSASDQEETRMPESPADTHPAHRDASAAQRPDGARPDAGPRRPHLRAASRRLGRRRHPDRAAGDRRRGRSRQPPRLRLPEPAPQQARDARST